MDHRQVEAFGEEACIADLGGKAPIRSVMHRLPVEADHLGTDALLLGGDQQHGHHVGVRVGDDGLGLGEPAEAVIASGHADCILQRRPQNSPLFVAIRLKKCRPELGDPLPVGANQSRIDAVHRRTAHQTECPHGRIARHF